VEFEVSVIDLAANLAALRFRVPLLAPGTLSSRISRIDTLLEGSIPLAGLVNASHLPRSSDTPGVCALPVGWIEIRRVARTTKLA